MPVRMLHDFFVRHFAWDAIALLIDRYRRHAENESAIPDSRLQLLYRMARQAGQPVAIEAAIHLRILRQAARQHADRVVAAIAVPRKLDPLAAQQNVDARSIK